MNILIVTAGHIYWALIMWKTLCRALYSYHAYNSSQLLLSSFYKRGNWGPEWFTKNSDWDCWASKPDLLMLLPHGSPPLCPCYFCNQDIQTRMDSEPADKAFSHLPSFSGQVQGKTEKGDMRSCWDQPCAPWPQRPECEADGTQTLIQDSHCPVWLFWHFIWIYLFILFKIHLCSQVGIQSTQTEILSRDVLLPSEKRWETAILLTARRKVIRKLRALCVFAC